MIEWNDIKFADPESVSTPVMLVYRDIVMNNIDTLCRLAGGGGNLLVHVKTHKSLEVTQFQLRAGVAGFKTATLSELEMVLKAGASLAILTYPLAQKRKVQRFVELCKTYSDRAVHAIVSQPLHVDLLAKEGKRHGFCLSALLDLDVGMLRTGVAIGKRAEEIYKMLHEGSYTRAAGLHAYDGHDHEPDYGKREGLALAHIQEVKRFRNILLGKGWPVDIVVGGGSFSFPFYAREEAILGSPGTAIYWDAGYSSLLPDMPFKWAAFLLTQVVDSYPEKLLFTTDLGNKAVAPDKPLEQRVFLPSVPDARLISQNEEHGVFKANPETLPQVGDYLLAVPGHICPTTIKYPYSLWVDAGGNVTGVNQHTARDRQ